MAPASRMSMRSTLAICLCGIQGWSASAEGTGTPRFYAEVQPGSSAIFLTKSQTSGSKPSAQDPAEAQSGVTAMRALGIQVLQHAAALGAWELLQQKQKSHHKPSKEAVRAEGAPDQAPSWMRSVLLGSLTAVVLLGWAARKQRRRSEKEMCKVIACLQEAKVAAERLEAENADLVRRCSMVLPPEIVEVAEPPKDAFIDVFLRVRPHYEKRAGSQSCLHVKGETEALLDMALKGSGTEQTLSFNFKGVFDSSAQLQGGGQEEIFDTVGTQVVESVLDGYHTCVFAFGQTGTGKTHTLIGSKDDPGLLPRMVLSLLQKEQQCTLSCVEIYMDKLRDLLLREDASEVPRLEIRGDTSGFSVLNLREVNVEDPQKAMKLITKASQNRASASTSMNSTSSRGHAIYQLKFASGAKLCVVDLAGRENERTTGCKGHNLAELAYINKSLFHLTNVLQALARVDAHQGQVPWRNSKLTMLLSECLQGARTTLLATVSPDSNMAEDTYSTIRVAQAVQQIRTRGRRNTGENEDRDKPMPRRRSSQPSGRASSKGNSPTRAWSISCESGARTPRGRPTVVKRSGNGNDSPRDSLNSTGSEGAPELEPSMGA